MPSTWIQTPTTTTDTGRIVPEHVFGRDGVEWHSQNQIASSGRYIVYVVADEATLDALRSTPQVTELTADNAISALRQTAAVSDDATPESFMPPSGGE